MFKVKKSLSYILGILILLGITYGSLDPYDGKAETLPYLDKAIHFSAYLFLSFYWKQVLNTIKGQYLFFVIWGYSILIEVLQPLTNRSFEYMDILANFLGVIAGISLAKKFQLIKIL
jgi:VanZ family protein